MSDAAVGLDARVLSAFAWREGCLLLGGNDSMQGADVQVAPAWPAGQARGLEMVIRYRACAVTTKFVSEINGVGRVRSFRYSGPDGEMRDMLVCVNCGATRVCHFSELQAVAFARCGKCGAQPSIPFIQELICVRHHAWGMCDMCTVAEGFKVITAGEQVAALFRKEESRPEDGSAPLAGPIAPSAKGLVVGEGMDEELERIVG